MSCEPLDRKNVYPRRNKAGLQVLSLVAPLGKLGRFEKAIDFFQVNALQLAYCPAELQFSQVYQSMKFVAGFLKKFRAQITEDRASLAACGLWYEWEGFSMPVQAKTKKLQKIPPTSILA